MLRLYIGIIEAVKDLAGQQESSLKIIGVRKPWSYLAQRL
jgi:hypothetical protein